MSSTTRVPLAWNGGHANGDSYGGSWSRDTRYMLFHSFASNLVEGDTNGVSDVFIRRLNP